MLRASTAIRGSSWCSYVHPTIPPAIVSTARPCWDWRARSEGRALVVVDEADIEFADAPSLTGAIGDYPGMVLLRTLSKAHGLAGARCGVLLGHAAVIALLRKVIQPYAVTQLTIEAVFRRSSRPRLTVARPCRDAQGRTRARRRGAGRQQRRAQGLAQRRQFPAGGIPGRGGRSRANACRGPAGARHAHGPRALARVAHQHGSSEQNDRLLSSLRSLQ